MIDSRAPFALSNKALDSSGEFKASCPIRALIDIKKCLLQTLTHNRLTERIKKDIQSRGGDNRDDNSHLPPNIRDKRPRSHDPVGQRCHTAADLGSEPVHRYLRGLCAGLSSARKVMMACIYIPRLGWHRLQFVKHYS